MKIKEKTLKLLSLTVIFVMLLSGCSQKSSESEAGSEKNYPSKNISGVVQWGAGGGTDSLMRPLASIAEKDLGVSIVIENKTGGTGSIATQYVSSAQNDGYTLLMGAENPQLYTILGISELTYDDFIPVFLIGDEVAGVVVGKDSKYSTFKELVEAALEEPEKITVATTGKGGMPWTLSSFVTAVTGATFNQIPYDSDASAKTAVLSGECDFTFCKIQTGIEDYKSGTLNYLAVVSTEKVEALKEVPTVIEYYPDFVEYLPWGPFYGIFVKEGTDSSQVERLTLAFQRAFEDSSYQTLLKDLNINPLGYSANQAKDYLKSWKYNTATALYKSGAIDKSPDELGINP